MLPRDYRLTAYNDSGASVDVTVTVRRWRFDSNGAVVFEGTEATLLSEAGVANGALAVGAAQDNTADNWIGFTGVVSLSNGTGEGPVAIYIEPSTDGGTSWPTAEKGIPIGAGIPVDNDEIAVQA